MIKIAAFKKPQLQKYSEYLAEILHTTYNCVNKQANKFSWNLEMVIQTDVADFKWNDHI